MFSRDEVGQIILNYFDENNLQYDEELEQDVYDLYVRQMREEVNKGLSPLAQESMITDNIYGLSIGESTERLARNRTDAKITEYFDNLMYEGATDDILRDMNANSIPTTILRGLKANSNFEYTIDGVTVLQEIDESSPDSIALKGFAIIKDGKYVYQWGHFEQLNPDKYLLDDDEQPEKKRNESIFDMRGTQLHGYTQNEIISTRSVITSSGITAKQEAYVTKTGKVGIRTRINGRFAKL